MAPNLPAVHQPFLFTLSLARKELQLPIPDNNVYGQQTSRWKQLKLARTLAEKLSQFDPRMSEKEQDTLLSKLYGGNPKAIQAAFAKGLITVSTMSGKYAETVFLATPSLVANHTDLYQSLHQTNEHSEPPSRHDMYTQTHQMYTLAKAIDVNSYGEDTRIPKWGSFLGSEPVSNDQLPNNFAAISSYIVPQLNSCNSDKAAHNPGDTRYPESLLEEYDKELSQANSELRNRLSNIIFVDMTEAALNGLNVPRTLQEFFAWTELENSEISNPLNVCTQSRLHAVGLPRTVRSPIMNEVWARLEKAPHSLDETSSVS